ncbi:MAG: hypothetical protein COC01_02920 [Bacteroidetes bacterium]|nr:MAG: hypothetical protein COC01_02920 [Bacteroidota bacterium]
MNKLVFIFLFGLIFLPNISNAQTEKGTILLQTTTDLFRSTTTSENLFKRFVIGFGTRYFVADKLGIGLGYEHAISQNQKSSTFYIAARFYPFGKTFIRIKPSFGKGVSTLTSTPKDFNTSLFSFGLGQDFMLGEKWSIEPNVDYNISISGGGSNFISVKVGLGIFI